MMLDRQEGFVARKLRERIGVDREAETLARVDRLERLLAYQLRQFKGIRIEAKGKNIVPGSDGWLALSTDSNAQFKRDPNRNPHHAKLSVTGTGCLTSLTVTEDHPGTVKTATDCGAKTEWIDGNGYICHKFSGSATAQLHQLATYWCAPLGDEPDNITEWVIPYGPPSVYITLAAGDECLGSCADYMVLGWPVPSP